MGKSRTSKKPAKVAKPTGPDKTIMTMELPVEEIRIDGNTQPREEMDLDTALEYSEAIERGDQFPPMRVMYDGTHYWLYDGFHRWNALVKLLSRKKVVVEVVNGTKDEAILAACAANKTHGLKRTTADKRRAVALVLELRSDWSDRAIADHVGVSSPTVAAVRKSTVKVLQSPNRTGRDGRTTNTTNIGSKPSDNGRAPTPETDSESSLEPDEDADTHQDSEDASDPAEGAPDAPATTEAEPTKDDATGEVVKTASTMPVLPRTTAPLDEEGIPIREDARDAFEAREIFDEIISTLRGVGKKINTLATSPGGAHLAAHLIKTIHGDKVTNRCEHLTSAVNKLKWARPYASVCPYCHYHSAAGEINPACKACRGQGWVTERAWEESPADYREAVKADALEGAAS